jgi:hypothetical protein
MARRSAPAGLAEKLAAADSPVAGNAAQLCWPLLRTLLLKEIAPLWAPCFI